MPTRRSCLSAKRIGALGSIQSVAIRKLDYIDQAVTLNGLKAPPANHLEQLSGDRKGQHSIRINRQYRICLIWNKGAHHAEIADYR